MKKSFFKLYGLLMIAILVASCSKSSDLLEMVPGDAMAVAIIKPNDLAQKANLENADLSKLPQENVQMVKEVLSGEYGVKTDQIIYFNYGRKDYLCLEISDIEKLKAKTGTEPTVEDGFNVFDIQGSKLVEKDGIGWMVDNNDYIADIKKFMSISPENAISSLSNFSEEMAGKDIACYLNVDAVISEADLDKYSSMPGFDKLRGAACYMNLAFDKKDITLTAKLYSADGKNLMKEFCAEEIDTDILKLFDVNSTAVIAQHLSSENLKQIKELLMASAGNAIEGAQLQTLINWLDGDIALACTLKNAQGFEGNDFAVAIKLKKDAQKDIEPFINTMGLSPNAEGEYNIPFSGLMIRAAFKDNYLFVSTMGTPAKGFDESEHASYFDGKCNAAFVDATTGSTLSSLLQIMTGGTKVNGYLVIGTNDEESKLQLHLENEDSNILASLLTIALGTI